MKAKAIKKITALLLTEDGKATKQRIEIVIPLDKDGHLIATSEMYGKLFEANKEGVVEVYPFYTIFEPNLKQIVMDFGDVYNDPEGYPSESIKQPAGARYHVLVWGPANDPIQQNSAVSVMAGEDVTGYQIIEIADLF